MIDIYLAGAMHGRLGQTVLVERARAKAWCKWYGLTYYDPSEDEDINPTEMIDLKPDLAKMKWYINKDDAKIDQCKFLLVLTGDTSSSGTGWEMGRMHYQNHRPVIVVAPKMVHGELTNFTTVKADKLFDKVDMAVKYIFDTLRGPIHAIHPD